LAKEFQVFCPVSRSLLRKLIVLIGCACLGAAGTVRAGYVPSLGLPPSPALGAAADDVTWTDSEAVAGAAAPAATDENSPRPHANPDEWFTRLLSPTQFAPLAAPQSGAGMTGATSSLSVASGQPVALLSGQPILALETAGRLFLVEVRHQPAPFPSRLFRPPRSL
jgi:hypothetical protein